MLIVRQVGVKGTHGDGALLVDLVDGPSQEVDDQVVELDFTDLGLQHFERLPCVFPQHAPDNHTMVAVHSLCQDQMNKAKKRSEKTIYQSWEAKAYQTLEHCQDQHAHLG